MRLEAGTMRPRQVNPLPGYLPEMGGWLWALEEVRCRTLSLVEGMDQRTLDWEGPDGRENAIGSLLYHIAVSEMRWLFLGILQRDLPPSAGAGFQHRDGRGRLTSVVGVPLRDHLACLRCSREFLLEALRPIPLVEWRRPCSPRGGEGFEFTPEWAVFHLVEHEAGHAFQISSLKGRARRVFASRDGRDGLAVSMRGESPSR
jgi:hypothetical protein